MSETADDVTKLWRWAFDDVPVERCFEYAAGPLDGLIRFGFSYSPDACRFFEVVEGRAIERREDKRPGGETSRAEVSLARVFEVRMFSKHFDLGWTRYGATGRLLIVADDPDVTDALGDANCAYYGLPVGAPQPPINVAARDHTYLVWGEALQQFDGWTRMVAPRIGSLWVPEEIPRGQRAQMRAREYFRSSDYGNVVFCGERLLGLEPATSSKRLQQIGSGDAA